MDTLLRLLPLTDCAPPLHRIAQLQNKLRQQLEASRAKCGEYKKAAALSTDKLAELRAKEKEYQVRLLPAKPCFLLAPSLSFILKTLVFIERYVGD